MISPFCSRARCGGDVFVMPGIRADGIAALEDMA